MKKSTNELCHFNYRLSLFHKLLGVDFSSCFEYSCCINKLNIQKHDGVLDVGALKSCFPLFLVKKGANVIALDVDERVYNQKKYAKKVGLNFSNDNDNAFDVKIGDARKIDFPDSSFDAVTCISAIEHIPGDGDIEAVKMMLGLPGYF
jgi:2-polyprenyl-3-methyl-5-hydroxy-6-metoxy-1,4-benzoquinol methylase